MPEPDDGKLSSPVLRGGWRSNALSLPSTVLVQRGSEAIRIGTKPVTVDGKIEQ